MILGTSFGSIGWVMGTYFIVFFIFLSVGFNLDIKQNPLEFISSLERKKALRKEYLDVLILIAIILFFIVLYGNCPECSEAIMPTGK